MAEFSTTKRSLREEVLRLRSRMAFEDVYLLSAAVQQRFIGTPEFRAATRLALYASFGNEVLTDDIFTSAVEAGKEVYFPRVVREGPHLAFYRVKYKEELSPGSYSIMEPPAGGPEARPEVFDCIVVPGIAFDLKGARLGYGKGYYDRVLAGASCPLVGLAFDFQVLDEPVPCEPHDVMVGLIVTESRIIKV